MPCQCLVIVVAVALVGLLQHAVAVDRGGRESLHIIIFSYNRAAQLDLLLNSMNMHFPRWSYDNRVKHTIIARCDGEDHRQAYEHTLQNYHENRLNVVWEQNVEGTASNASFRKLFLRELGGKNAGLNVHANGNDLVFTMVDDVIMRKGLDVDYIFQLFKNNPEALSLDAAMHPQLSSFYYTPELQVPNGTGVGMTRVPMGHASDKFGDTYVWNWANVDRANKSLLMYRTFVSLASSIFRREDMAYMCSNTQWHSPNTLENNVNNRMARSQLKVLQQLRPLKLVNRENLVVISVWNRVNIDFDNRVQSPRSDQLKEDFSHRGMLFQFLVNNKRLKVPYLPDPSECQHVELPVEWVEGPGMNSEVVHVNLVGLLRSPFGHPNPPRQQKRDRSTCETGGVREMAGVLESFSTRGQAINFGEFLELCRQRAFHSVDSEGSPTTLRNFLFLVLTSQKSRDRLVTLRRIWGDAVTVDFPENIVYISDEENPELHTVTTDELKDKTTYKDAQYRIEVYIKRHRAKLLSNSEQRYVFFMDDDTFVNLRNVLYFVNSLPKEAWKLPIALGHVYASYKYGAMKQDFISGASGVLFSAAAFRRYANDIGERSVAALFARTENIDVKMSKRLWSTRVQLIHCSRFRPYPDGHLLSREMEAEARYRATKDSTMLYLRAPNTFDMSDSIAVGAGLRHPQSELWNRLVVERARLVEALIEFPEGGVSEQVMDQFLQIIIFVNHPQRAAYLSKLLRSLDLSLGKWNEMFRVVVVINKGFSSEFAEVFQRYGLQKTVVVHKNEEINELWNRISAVSSSDTRISLILHDNVEIVGLLHLEEIRTAFAIHSDLALIDLTEQYGSTSLPMTPHYVGLGLYKWTWTRSNTLPIALGPATLLKTSDFNFFLGILPSIRTERENHLNERSPGSIHYQLEFALNSSPEIQSLMNRERAFCGCLAGPPRARVQKDVL